MVIDKVINNNLVRSINDQQQEILVMGSGLGFKKRPGDPINDEKIEKIYVLSDNNGSGQKLEQKILIKCFTDEVNSAILVKA